MTHMTKTLLEMSELRSVPCNDAIDLAPMIEEVLTDLAPLAEQKGITLVSKGDAQTIGCDTLIYRLRMPFATVRPAQPCKSAPVPKATACCFACVTKGRAFPSNTRRASFSPSFVSTDRAAEHMAVWGWGLRWSGRSPRFTAAPSRSKKARSAERPCS